MSRRAVGAGGWVFHGTPSSRLEPAVVDDVCAELGVRLVGLDRPG